MNILEDITAKRVFYHFEQISKIPRGSGDERQISEYLLQFGRKLGLQCIKDQALNIIIKKPATKGYEKAPTVIIQGHMDMVCEKNNETKHDFTKDPIKLVIKNDYIYADGTTLGADNGIAVAYAMALLEDNTIEHPALEILLTSNEEAGMTGAMEIDSRYINGKILLNLDSEEEGKLLVSCAGGIRTKSELPIKWISKKENTTQYKLLIKGLKGGHSGAEIHLGRGNANKLMGRLLKRISNEIQLNLVAVNGGTKNNSIPRESIAVISINNDDSQKLMEIKKMVCEEIKQELKIKDPRIKIDDLEFEDNVEKVFSDETTHNVINLLYMYPNGINTVSSEIKGLTESSTNIGVVVTNHDNVEFDSAIRSSVFSLRQDILQKIKCITELMGGSFTSNSGYPEWPYKIDSPLREICKDVYNQMYDKNMEVVAIHAGVECGLFKEKLGDLDMISFGPDIFDAHTPAEHMSISSVERVWEYLLEVLKKIKA